MFFRWRRSLPTENARSPAPVMITTLTALLTATVSSTSVSRAPISVVIALSGGALRVITAMRPSSSYSSSTGSAAPPSAAGGPKSSASQRFVRINVATFASSSAVQFAEPAQGREAGCEAVLAAPCGDERHQPLQAPTDGVLRDRERAGPVPPPDERVGLLGRADEDAVVEPLRLDELELALEVRADEDEDDSAVDAVVLEHGLGEHRPVARAAADHPVETHVDVAVAVERVARVRTPRVGAHRALEALEVVAVEVRVVAVGIGPQLAVVGVGRERQRCSALPAADHLRAQLRLLRTVGCVRAQVLAVGGDVGVQLPEDDVRP